MIHVPYRNEDATRPAQVVDVVPRQGDAVAAAQLEHQLGLQAALDMQVQFGLGQTGDETVERVHDYPLASTAAPTARALTPFIRRRRSGSS